MTIDPRLERLERKEKQIDALGVWTRDLLRDCVGAARPNPENPFDPLSVLSRQEQTKIWNYVFDCARSTVNNDDNFDLLDIVDSVRVVCSVFAQSLNYALLPVDTAFPGVTTQGEQVSIFTQVVGARLLASLAAIDDETFDTHVAYGS